MEYGVQTHNKFAFLDDDVDVSDPEEALSKKVEEAKKAAVAAALAAKKVTIIPPVTKSVAQKENEKPSAPPPAPTVSERKRTSDGSGAAGGDKGRSGWSPRGERSRGGGTRGGPRGDHSRGGGTRGEPRGDRSRGGGTRGGPRGDRSRGGGTRAEPRGEPRTNNEESDNKPKESENGGGWDTNVGWDNEEVTEKVENPKTEEKAENNAVEEAKEPEVEQVEQVTREKTYEEWKNEQQLKNAEQIHFNTRKPGEGDDQKLYKKLIPMKNPNAKGPKHGSELDEFTQHKEKREKALAIDLSFSDKRNTSGGGFPGFGDRGGGPRGERPRGGGGARGGPRGDRPRGGGTRGEPRGGARNDYSGEKAGETSKRQQSGSFLLENEQFPALGAAH